MDRSVEWFLEYMCNVYVESFPLKDGTFLCTLWWGDGITYNLGISKYPLTLYQAVEQVYLDQGDGESE